MLRSMRTVACAAAVAMAAAGCSTMTRTDCAVVGGIAGATVGGAGGAAAANNLADNPNDWKRAAGAGGAGVAGAVIGALIGWNVCHEPVPAPMATPPPPPPAGTKIAEIRGTNFAFDSSKLTSEGEAILDEAVAVLNQNPDINVRIEGHTDSVGSDAYNMKLGQRRADTVRNYLVSKGISKDRMTTRSFGESVPVASNDTEAGRAQNRRVEIIVD
jgi:OmpA-OmpF porin, OOP family